MLVLTRKPGEQIHIGAGITITVVDIRANKIRIGIDAPADVTVLRAELNGFLPRFSPVAANVREKAEMPTRKG